MMKVIDSVVKIMIGIIYILSLRLTLESSLNVKAVKMKLSKRPLSKAERTWQTSKVTKDPGKAGSKIRLMRMDRE